MKLRTKRIYHTKEKARSGINVNKMSNEKLIQEFTTAITEYIPGPPAANAQARWEHLRDIVYSAALDTFGRKKKSANWFRSHSKEMEGVIMKKRSVVGACKVMPLSETCNSFDDLCTTRHEVQRTAKRCANDYWLHFCSNIQHAATRSNIKEMYDDFKLALGSHQGRSHQ